MCVVGSIVFSMLGTFMNSTEDVYRKFVEYHRYIASPAANAGSQRACSGLPAAACVQPAIYRFSWEEDRRALLLPLLPDSPSSDFISCLAWSRCCCTVGRACCAIWDN